MQDSPLSMVRFPLADVVHPNPLRVLEQLFDSIVLTGRVITPTTDGTAPYLVVHVEGLTDALIVRSREGQSVPPPRTSAG